MGPFLHGGDVGGGSALPVERRVDASAIFARHRADVFRFCLSRLGNQADADDAVQETFLRAAPRLTSLSGDPAAYLTVVARNVCHDSRARAIRVGRTAEDIGELAGAACPEKQAIARVLLHQLVHSLSRRDRALLAYDASGLSSDEIGRRLGMSATATRVALMRARQRARRIAVANVLVLPAWRSRRALVHSWAQAFAGRLRVANDAAGTAAAAVAAAVVLGAGGTAPVPAVAAHGQRMPSTATVDPATPARRSDAPAGERMLASLPPAAPRPAATSAPASSGSAAEGRPIDQRDVLFDTASPSPDYQADHTIYATGTMRKGCADDDPNTVVACFAFLVSRDGGTTWRVLLASDGFQTGAVLVAPAGRPLFVAGGLGLQRSDDGGHSFTVVAPGGPAALVTSSSGAPRIFVAGSAPLLYDISTGAVIPGPVLPAGLVGAPEQVAGAGSSVFLTASQADPLGQGYRDVVVRCPQAGACRVVLQLPDGDAANLAVSPAFASDRTLAVANDGKLYTSHDGGGTFAVSTLPSAVVVRDLAFSADYAASHVLDLALGTAEVGFGGVMQWNEGRVTSPAAATSAAGLPPANEVFTLFTALPDGRLLASLNDPATPLAAYGLWCSSNGETWTRGC